MIITIPDDWTPSAENINALPKPLREYIRLLECRSDPATLVQQEALVRIQNQALNKMLDEAPEGVLYYEWLGDTLAEVTVRTSEPESIARHRAADLEGKRVRLVVCDE